MKNTIKKFSILASAFIMAVANCFTAVSAAEEAETVKTVDVSNGYASETINLSDAVAIAGNSLMVQLSLSTGDQCTGYNLDIEFDDRLTLKSVEGAISYCVIDNVVTVVNFTGTYFQDDQVLTTFIFDAPEDAVEGAVYDIGVKNVADFTGSDDEEIEEVAVKNSSVEIIESAKDVTNNLVYNDDQNIEVGLRGDVNGDKNVDLYDAIKTTKAIMGTERLNEKEAHFADVNENGVVDLYDTIAICRYGLMADKSTAWETILNK